MKAMILAAGKGTRLHPLTDSVPKILVPVLGVPMLARLRAYLARAGVERLALNTHHLAHQVRAFVHQPGAEDGDALPIRLFHEPVLLGTGGAMVNAVEFWAEDPLVVWNGDIVADVDPTHLVARHQARGALATLVLQARESDSRLLVDAAGNVCGIDSQRRGMHRMVREPRGTVSPRAFNGISVVSAALRGYFPPAGTFDLVDGLLDAISAGADVHAYDMERGFFGTTGSPAQLARLEAGLGTQPDLLARWSP